jgi:hypothetical protein
LVACLKALREGDLLILWKLDPLGRDLRHLVNTVHDLTARGVGLGAHRPGRGDRHRCATCTTRASPCRRTVSRPPRCWPWRVVLPALAVIDRVCSEVLTRGTRWVYGALTARLSAHNRRALDDLLTPRDSAKDSGLIWLRQPPGPPRPRHVLVHLERLKTVHGLALPEGLEAAVHQNRLLKLAREGGQMTAQPLRDLEPERRYATLVAVLLETRATLIDEIIDLHDRFMAALFGQAKRHHLERFEQSGR